MLIEDFSFNGIKLSEKKGYLTSENKELYQLVPSYTIVEHTVPNVGETKFIKKIRNPYEFRLELFFMDIPTLTEISSWLNTDTPQKFKFIQDPCAIGEINVTLVDYITPEVYLNENNRYNVLVSAKFKEYV